MMTGAKMLYQFCFVNFFLFISIAALAQPCIPDTQYTEPGIYPSAFPEATADVQYEEVLHFVFPEDTTIFDYNFTIDSAWIVKIENFPYGFVYNCNNGSCGYKGGERGCLLVSGLPHDSTIGTRFIKVHVKMRGSNAQLGTITETIEDTLEFVVNPSNTGVEESTQISQLQLLPNPAKGNSRLLFSLPHKEYVTITITDITGKKVHKTIAEGQQGQNSIKLNLSTLPGGIYLFTVSAGNLQQSGKFMVRK